MAMSIGQIKQWLKDKMDETGGACSSMLSYEDPISVEQVINVNRKVAIYKVCKALLDAINEP